MDDLQKHKIKKQINSELGLNDNNSNISQAISDAEERNILYNRHDMFKEKQLKEKYGISEDLCYNATCVDNKEGCNSIDHPSGCLFRMTKPPPNSLNYDMEYFPSHQECLDMLQKYELIKQDKFSYEESQPRYNRPKTQCERNNFTLKLERWKFKKCITETLLDTPQDFDISERSDADIIANNAANCVEREMRVYPNICSI